MAGLKIPYLKELSPENPDITTGRLMVSGAMFKIDKINWNEFPHLPEVKVYTGYCDQRLWLHYLISNDFVRSVYHLDQDPVWQDSCVEFFVKQGEIYHNFEFNCLGVCLSAFGPDRYSRKSLDIESMVQILRFPSLNTENLPSEDIPTKWSLTIAIPLNLIGLKAGSEFWANFYKCGDETRVPHYVSWSPIDTLTPDFHRPEYFGSAELVK